VLLPFIKKELWRAAPVAGSSCSASRSFRRLLITIGLLGYNLWEWLTNANYGVNNKTLAYYMGAAVRPCACDL
jgi:hypothetical protein